MYTLDERATVTTSTSTSSMKAVDSRNKPQYCTECWTSQAKIRYALADTKRTKEKTGGYDQEDGPRMSHDLIIYREHCVLPWIL